MSAIPSADNTVWTYMRSLANKRLKLNSAFYADGNRSFGIDLQSVAVDVDDDDQLRDGEWRFQCEVPGCGRWLHSVLEHEAHYSSRHRHRCGVCAAELASQHLLELHLDERHDSVFQLKARRQSMYRCLVESCGRLSADAESRLQHCVDEHHYPADFCCSPAPPAQKKPSPTTAAVPARAENSPRRRFSYRVPEGGISFGAAGVASFRREAAGTAERCIDIASLSAALDAEQPI